MSQRGGHLRSNEIGKALTPRASSLDIVLCSTGIDPSFLHEAAQLFGQRLQDAGIGADLQIIDGRSASIIRLTIAAGTRDWPRLVDAEWEELPQRADLHPDVWDPIVVGPGVQLVDALRGRAGPKYSYRELDDFTDRIEKAIRLAPEASRVTRVGVLEEQIEARYSQDRIAALGIVPAAISGVLQSRNTTVLFDFIEEQHAQGVPLEVALIEAGTLRIRPVLITVAATVLALFPLGVHGGPLWEALCYAQIGGLTFATAVTLFIVPVLYAVFVLDLKVVRWESR